MQSVKIWDPLGTSIPSKMIKTVVLLSCLVAASVAQKSCNIFLNDGVMPHQRSSPTEQDSFDSIANYVTLLTEFSRFMNKAAPKLLEVNF